jgi:hypothetical protein
MQRTLENRSLKVLAVAAGRNLAVGVLRREPHLCDCRVKGAFKKKNLETNTCVICVQCVCEVCVCCVCEVLFFFLRRKPPR